MDMGGYIAGSAGFGEDMRDGVAKNGNHVLMEESGDAMGGALALEQQAQMAHE